MSLGARAPEARRRLILDAAREVLRERGFAGARVTDIARRAGTSSGLVVYHFGTLSALLSEAVTRAEQDFYDDLQRRLGDAARPASKLRYCAQFSAEDGRALGDWALWLEIWVQALRDSTARTAREHLDRRLRDTLAAIIVEGCVDGTFSCADPPATAARLASLIDGLAVQLALGDPAMNSERMMTLWLTAAAIELGVDVKIFDQVTP
jgi:AcrR family transcriptional regulator